jgi:hypothetical protein
MIDNNLLQVGREFAVMRRAGLTPLILLIRLVFCGAKAVLGKQLSKQPARLGLFHEGRDCGQSGRMTLWNRGAGHFWLGLTGAMTACWRRTPLRTSPTTEGPLRMNALSLFGLFAVTAMLVAYALESRNRWWTLAFAGACGLGSLYGFLQGAWPFGLVEAVWAVVALNKWRMRS